MKLCPITYEPCGDERYSKRGLKMLSPGLKDMLIFDYSAEELRTEAFYRARKISIQGVQPKVSAVLNIKEQTFDIVDRGGRYILKPQHQYFALLPENEDLTMKMAAMIGLEVPVHGMIWSKDGSLTYFIKRFDRMGQKDKVAIEDFAQLAGLSRDTKYTYSMEKVVKLLDDYCTFPMLEKAKLFKMTLFSYLIGNEDNHLKNFSIINSNGKIEISPCYDLLNTTIVLHDPEEEVALSIKGKKSRLSRKILIDYFGGEYCELTDVVIKKTLETIEEAIPKWKALIDISFLTDEMKEKYHTLLKTRIQTLDINPLTH